MNGLELVVVLGAAVLVGHFIASRTRLPAPIVLLVAGVLVGLVPTIQETELPPELVLLVFLPVLLYWESLTTSLREIRANIGLIVVLSTGLVIVSAAAVAVTAHLLLGLPWPSAWVLGAAVAPTDATAVSALSRMLPRRQVTVLRAESLINDGTALVIYGIAVGIAAGERTFSPLPVAGGFLLSYGGGVLAGIVVAFVNAQLRRRVADPLLGNLVMILAPFTAYLLAEGVGASGVVAVVVSGLIMSQVAPRIIRAEHRAQALAFWPLITFLINGALFVLVGVELQHTTGGLPSDRLLLALLGVGAVSAVLVGIRIAFFLLSAAGPSIARRLGRSSVADTGPRARIVSGLAGFRGAVSLAVALSVPQTIAGGGAFPGREVIVFVTSGVILVTLVAQGVLLPVVAQWARMPPDLTVEEEQARAETTALAAAVQRLPDLAAARGTDPAAEEWLRQEYDSRLADATARAAHDPTAPAARATQDYTTLALDLVAVLRSELVRLRDAQTIDDTVLRRLQLGLDDEELRLRRREPIE